ncbi:hypothetical protein KVT40_002691 [Elsinoe batatas]|uniref:SUN domain-containing protein n=1 Tax=Elsinoe batatas TaxID=2601811 RepID=A0A8K0L2Q4_9PEZI|nr:hypothetical protein KVT40_002691 [Elsinoe batatas]
MSGTPARRTRAGSRTSATPAPVAAPVVATPRTGGRRRPPVGDGTLPAVPTGINTSYGSVGRVEITSQVKTTGARGTVLQDIAAATAAANRRRGIRTEPEENEGNNDERQTSPAPSETRSQGSSRPGSRAGSTTSGRPRRPTGRKPVAVEEPINEESDGEQLPSRRVQPIFKPRVEDPATTEPSTDVRRTSVSVPNPDETLTGIGSSFSYVPPGQSHHIPATPSIPVLSPNQRRNLEIARRLRIDPPATQEEVEAARPWFTRVLKETIPRLWDEAGPEIRGAIMFALISPFLFSFLLFLHNLLPANINIIRTVQNLADSIGEQAAKARNATMYNPAFDANLHARVDRLDSDVKNLKVQWSEIKDILPEQFMVSKNSQTGTWDIPPTFWTAIESKLNSDYSLTPGSTPGAAPAWDSFVRANQKKINTMLSASADEATKSHLSKLSTSGTIVNKEMFLAALDENTAQLRRELSTIRADATRTAKTIASSIAASLPSRQTPSKSTPAYLEDITLLTLARNHLLSRERNFLSAGLGAVIDPYLTSPTFAIPQPNILAKAWTYTPWSTVRVPHPPAMALAPWSEAGDCWCAARSITHPGAAQIAALLVTPVDPTALVVEHVPAISTLDIQSAPRDLEVWGLPANLSIEGFSSPPITSKEERQGECTGPEPEEGRGWICLGKAAYDLHAQNWMQTFGLEGKGQMVQKVVVRVLGNWDGEKTCVYRLRVLGRTEAEVRGEME